MAADRADPARILSIALIVLGAVALPAPQAAAHEHVIVGEYELIVGWREEPPIAGFPNGLDLTILNGTRKPVIGAEDTLNATLSIGPASVTKALEPQFGRNGSYTFDVVPTRPGAYSVRIFGTLGTTPVNESVTIQEVGPASDFAFPDPDPTARELQEDISAADAIIAGLRSQMALALGLAAVGLIVGGVGLAFGCRMAQAARKAQ